MGNREHQEGPSPCVLPFLGCSLCFITKENPPNVRQGLSFSLPNAENPGKTREKRKKPSKFTKDLLSLPNAENPRKTREKTRFSKEIPLKKSTKETQTIKERKDRELGPRSRRTC